MYSRMRVVLVVLVFSVMLPLAAEAGTPEVVPKNGSCPYGYRIEGNYCVGGTDKPSPNAVPKDGLNRR